MEESFLSAEKKGREARANVRKKGGLLPRKRLTNHGQDPPADLEELIGEDGSGVAVSERGEGPREGRELVLWRRRHRSFFFFFWVVEEESERRGNMIFSCRRYRLCKKKPFEVLIK